ncbi:hypothetical protein [Neptunomonas sp.]|uniref:hypothetical protein n=1 Tax=Neptunomonas sp. TaxID=1971898 RepID=UPI003562C63B
MAIANGTLMRAYPEGTAISCEVTSTFDSSFSTDKTACKDTPNGELKPGPIDFSISGEALFELSPAGQGFQDLMALHINKTEFLCNYIASEAGGFTIAAAKTYLTQISITGGTEESVRFNFTITGSGDYTIS